MSEVTRAIRLLIISTVVLFGVVAVLAVGGYLLVASQQAAFRREQVRLTRLIAETHGSECALRRGLEEQVAQAEKYLRETPNLIPGVTPAQIRQSIARERATIRAFARLECK